MGMEEVEILNEMLELQRESFKDMNRELREIKVRLDKIGG